MSALVEQGCVATIASSLTGMAKSRCESGILHANKAPYSRNAGLRLRKVFQAVAKDERACGGATFLALSIESYNEPDLSHLSHLLPHLLHPRNLDDLLVPRIPRDIEPVLVCDPPVRSVCYQLPAPATPRAYLRRDKAASQKVSPRRPVRAALPTCPRKSPHALLGRRQRDHHGGPEGLDLPLPCAAFFGR